MAKRKIPYGKVIAGMEHCFGVWSGGSRECYGCPYEEKNDPDDVFGDAPAFCMEALTKDVKRWAQELSGFTHCEDCSCWRRNMDEEGNHHLEWDGKEGYCGVWNTVMNGTEFCARGDRK